jgi:type II secretory pathway component PulF
LPHYWPGNLAGCIEIRWTRSCNRAEIKFPGSLGIADSDLVPLLFSRMVRIGEETGRLAPILSNIAQLYEEDSDRLLDRAVSLLQPVLLVAMGVIIGATLLAILLPLANFGELLNM